MAKSAPKDAVRQDFRRPRRRPAAGRHLHPLHRPPSRARGDEPAGVRGPAHGQAQGACAREDAGRGRPQHRHHRGPQRGHQGRGEPHPGRDLAKNAKDFGIEYYDERDIRQGIVHVIGPEQGFTLPGTTIVCGDSHTSTHGAFGALAHGIGTSEVEHVLATQTLTQKKAKNMRVYRRRQAAGRRRRQGHHPVDHRPDRHRRRHRPRHRVRGRGHPRAQRWKAA